MRNVISKFTSIRYVFLQLTKLALLFVSIFCYLRIVKCTISIFQILRIMPNVLVFLKILKFPLSLFNSIFKTTCVNTTIWHQCSILILKSIILKTAFVLEFSGWLLSFFRLNLPLKSPLLHKSFFHNAYKSSFIIIFDS